MKVTYAPEATVEWRASLTDSQRRRLASIHRQGRHLPDGTNHGSDRRWKQAGVSYRGNSYRGEVVRVHQTDTHAHMRVLIVPEDWGFTAIGLHKLEVYVVDGSGISPVEGYVGVWADHHRADCTTSWHPSRDEIVRPGMLHAL
jgi:hypothetical protein